MRFASLIIPSLTLSLAAIVNSAAIPRAALDVFVPRIISPDNTTIWTIGNVETVRWDTSDAPVNISNGAEVILYYPVEVGHQQVASLAKGFNLRSGSVNFTVPLVTPGLYTITLFGDSGDMSPNFQIINKS